MSNNKNYLITMLIYFLFSSVLIVLFAIYKYRITLNDEYLSLIGCHYVALCVSVIVIKKYLFFFKRFSNYESIILKLGFACIAFIISLYIILYGKRTNTGVNHSDIMLFLTSGGMSAYFMWYFYLLFKNTKNWTKHRFKFFVKYGIILKEVKKCLKQ